MRGVYDPHAVRGYFSSTVLKWGLTGLTSAFDDVLECVGNRGDDLRVVASFLLQAHVLLFTTTLLFVDAMLFILGALLVHELRWRAL